MSEVGRRTEMVDEGWREIAAPVVRAVRDVNETLAVHAAWTDERFEAVDDRMVSLSRIQVMTCGKVEMLLAGIDSRLTGLGVGQAGMVRTLSKLERDQTVLFQDHVGVVQKAERLEHGQEVLRQELAALVEAVRGLATRIDELLALAVSDELRQRASAS